VKGVRVEGVVTAARQSRCPAAVPAPSCAGLCVCVSLCLCLSVSLFLNFALRGGVCAAAAAAAVVVVVVMAVAAQFRRWPHGSTHGVI